MRKRNSVKQLNRVTSHRHAMMRNMVTSLFDHERIITTRTRAKALRPYTEKLITRARKNLDPATTDHAKLHNKREIMKVVRDRDIVKKLFEDIAERFKERPGGYTRIIHLPERASDSAQMSIIELVERKDRPRRERRAKAAAVAGDTGTTTKDSTTKKSGVPQREKKWFSRFRKDKEEGGEEESSES